MHTMKSTFPPAYTCGLVIAIIRYKITVAAGPDGVPWARRRRSVPPGPQELPLAVEARHTDAPRGLNWHRCGRRFDPYRRTSR